jgi:hypothetical protein
MKIILIYSENKIKIKFIINSANIFILYNIYVYMVTFYLFKILMVFWCSSAMLGHV